MANVPPRGLHGWPFDGSGTTPRAATAVHVARADGTWCPVSEVYAWCEDTPGDGAWLPVWAVTPRASGPVTAVQLGGAQTGQPIRVQLDWTSSPNAMRVDGAGHATTPDIAALAGADLLTVEVEVALDDWTPAAQNVLAGQWGAAGQRSWRVRTSTTTQLLAFEATLDGTTVDPFMFSSPHAAVDGERKWLGFDVEADNGTGSSEVAFRDGLDGVDWSTWDTADNTTDLPAGLFNSAAVVSIGGDSTGSSTGLIYRARIYADGVLVASPDFTAQPLGTTQFTDAQGNVWTVQAGADIVEANPLLRTADTWRIVRPDGTVAGEVPYTTVQFVDNDPRPTPTGGRYRVVPLLGGVVGPHVESNSIVLGAAPTVTTATRDSNFHIVLGPGGVHPATASGMALYRPGAASPFVTAAFHPGMEWRDETPNPGQVGQYKACSRVNGRTGGCSLFPSVTTRPAPPRPQWTTRGSSNGVDGKVSFGFWGPASGTWDSFRVQIFAAGAWRDLGTGYLSGVVADYNPQVWGGGGYVTSIRFRVATRLNGVESDYAYGETINPYRPPSGAQVIAANSGDHIMAIRPSFAGTTSPVTHFRVQVYDPSRECNWCVVGDFPKGSGNSPAASPIPWESRHPAVYASTTLIGPGGYSASVNAGPVDMSWG